MRGAEKTAGDESRQHRERKRVAEARLVQRARTAAIGHLHRGAEHEGTQQQAHR
jgi:hypothetical protein